MSSIVTTFKSYADLVSMKPARERDISIAETQLSLNFAADYREYLAEFGVAAANGHEFTGIVSSQRLNVANVTKREWENNPQVPHTLYVVENAGIDGIMIWQNASGKIYQSAPNAQPKMIASSLAEYLTQVSN